MDIHVPESINFSALDQKLVRMDMLVERLSKFLQSSRPASIPKEIYENVTSLADAVSQIRKSVNALETERRNLRALADVSEVVNSSLDLDVVLTMVMDTIIRITRAERGFLMLTSDGDDMNIRMARNWEKESIDPSEFAISHSVIKRVLSTGSAVLTTNAQEDTRFNFQQSVVAYNLRSILCVPLKVKEVMTGVIYADNRIRSGLFSQKELDLLTAFANEAAVAIENARLFASVRRTLAEVTELKNLMDNVFESIASGVITADVEKRIVMCNRAAQMILGNSSVHLIGSELQEAYPPLAPALNPYLDYVLKTDQPVVGLETSPLMPERGQVELRLSLSPMKDVQQTMQGVAIVLEDLTEKRKLEAQRRLFERMVSPAVIDRLDPNSLQLGGQRSEITILFADLRDFTTFSETVEPEELVSVLNSYLAVAAEAVLNEGGTVDKFLGDAVMAWFNAPIPQVDHTMRAVRAALAIRDRITLLGLGMPASRRLSFGIGIHVGEAVLGLIGNERRLDYTAIGDSVNTGRRIQENAAPGQILISQEAYLRVLNQIEVSTVDPIQAKGKRDPLLVYSVNCLSGRTLLTSNFENSA